MRLFLFALLVIAVCTPLVLVGALFAEAHWPALDRFTLAEPMPVRVTVSSIAMGDVGYKKDEEPKIRRVLKLNPNNPQGWDRLCSITTSVETAKDKLANCKRAVELDPSDINWYNLAYGQESAGDFCTAENSYESANSKVPNGDSDDLRGMGRAALQCGRVAYSIAELEAAEDLDVKAEKDGPDDDVSDDLTADREWLILAYNANRQPQRAAEACTLAHPAWKACSCAVKAGTVACTGTAIAPAGAAKK